MRERDTDSLRFTKVKGHATLDDLKHNSAKVKITPATIYGNDQSDIAATCGREDFNLTQGDHMKFGQLEDLGRMLGARVSGYVKLLRHVHSTIINVYREDAAKREAHEQFTKLAQGSAFGKKLILERLKYAGVDSQYSSFSA